MGGIAVTIGLSDVAAKPRNCGSARRAAEPAPPDHAVDARWATPEKTLRTFVGAVKAGDLCKLPVMVDFGYVGGERNLDNLLGQKLRSGDIYTHCFYAPVPILDDKGRLLPYLFEARKRGPAIGLQIGMAAFDGPGGDCQCDRRSIL